MKSGSFFPENLLGSAKAQVLPMTLTNPANISTAIAETSRPVDSQDGHSSGEVRSTVARRFMQMLQVHDRARREVLATHPTPAR